MTECIAYRLDSKTFATLYFGTFDSFLAGLSINRVSVLTANEPALTSSAKQKLGTKSLLS